MEKSGKRGKIPQTDWPLIMSRYEAGETLSSIARTYDCSPPAISYIVSRSRGKPASETTSATTAEPQLVKIASNGLATNGSGGIEPTPVPPASEVRAETLAEVPSTPSHSNGSANGGAAPSSEPRRTLHLSLGNGSANGNGQAAGLTNGSGNGQHAVVRPHVPLAPRPPQGPSQPALQDAAARPVQPPHNSPAFDAGRDGRDLLAISEGRPAPQQPREAEPPRKDAGAFIDQELRSRVDGDIAAFLAAFDAALAADTHESRFGLREATDRLLRAGARTRIELERLEARVPLPGREGTVQPEPTAWRYR